MPDVNTPSNLGGPWPEKVTISVWGPSLRSPAPRGGRLGFGKGSRSRALDRAFGPIHFFHIGNSSRPRWGRRGAPYGAVRERCPRRASFPGREPAPIGAIGLFGNLSRPIWCSRQFFPCPIGHSSRILAFCTVVQTCTSLTGRQAGRQNLPTTSQKKLLDNLLSSLICLGCQ